MLAIDARHIHSGIGTYISSLLRGLEARRRELDFFVITQPAHHARIAALTSAEIRDVDAPLYAVRGQWTIPGALRGSALFHATQYDLPVLRMRTMATIYDLTQMQREFVPSSFAWMYANVMLRRAARKACHIVTISEFSKQQIVHRLGRISDDVTVAYPSISPAFRLVEPKAAASVVAQAFQLHGPYILYVGNLKPHKGVPTLLRAFRSLSRLRSAGLELVVVGDDPRHAGELQRLAAELGVGGQTHFISHVAGELLPSVYAASACFVLPSYSEGFGLPVLEAMTCGTAAVCARSSSLPEVGGEAAAYFTPGQSEELAAVLERIIESNDERRTMIARGFEQSKRFSTEQFVARHCEIYRKWLGN